MRAVKVFIMILSFAAGAAAADGMEGYWQEHPFWETPAKAAILEKGHVLVSAYNDSHRGFMKGVGHVRAPMDFSYRFAQEFSRLEKIPRHFSEVSYDKATRILKMQVDLPFRAKEEVQIRVIPLEDGPDRRLQFEILKGFSTGTKGVLRFEDLRRQEPMTRISLQAVTAANKEFSWITNMGIEALLRHVAISLRSLLEKEKP